MAIGQSKQRLDAEAKVTGRARYTDDMGLPGMRHAAYVHSTIAHGMVLSIDASEALALPGVEGVFTADDVPGFLFPTAGHPYSMDPSTKWPWSWPATVSPPARPPIWSKSNMSPSRS